MPNWCQNKLTLAHDSRDMLESFCKAFNEDNTCNSYLPQPEDIGDGWYDWRCNSWGTKWDFGADGGRKAIIDEEGRVSVSFDSAWSPPIGLYKKLAELGFEVEATYFEGGMCFFGFYSNGVDSCGSFRDVDGIPSEIVEEFGLAGWIEDVRGMSAL